jgi:hypothetical protein
MKIAALDPRAIRKGARMREHLPSLAAVVVGLAAFLVALWKLKRNCSP